MPKIDMRLIENVLTAMQSDTAANSCTSKTFAGICMKLSSFYTDLSFTRWRNARSDPRNTHDYCLELQDKFYRWQDASNAWTWKYNELTDITGVRGVVERRRARKQLATFERLLFQHWDNRTGCWTFGKYTFG